AEVEDELHRVLLRVLRVERRQHVARARGGVDRELDRIPGDGRRPREPRAERSARAERAGEDQRGQDERAREGAAVQGLRCGARRGLGVHVRVPPVANITSVALITATAWEPTCSFNRSVESVVITPAMRTPGAISTT